MKHLLNNLSSDEKNRILEQHKGGMKVYNENFNKLLKNKLGSVKPLVMEQEGTPQTTGTTPAPTTTETIPSCYTFEKGAENPVPGDVPVPGADTEFNFPSAISFIKEKPTVSPQYQGLYLYGADGKAFCYFPKQQ